MLKKLIALLLQKFLIENRGYIAHQSLPGQERIDYSSYVVRGQWVSLVAPDDGFFTIVSAHVITCELQTVSLNTLSGSRPWGKTFIPCRKGETVRYFFSEDDSGSGEGDTVIFVKLLGAQSS